MPDVVSQADRATQARNARWLAGLLLIATAGSTLLAVGLGLYRGAWQHYVDAVAFGVALVASGVSLGLIRRQRQAEAAWLMIGSLTLAIWTLTAVIAGVGAVTGTGLALSTTVIAGQLLPSKRRWRGIAIGVSAGVVAVFYDFYGPADRLAADPIIQLFAVTLVLGVVVAYGSITARQFPNYSLRTKLIIGFLVVALAPLLVVMYLNDLAARGLLREQARLTLLEHATRMGGEVDHLVGDNAQLLFVEARLPDWAEYLGLPPDRRRGSEAERQALNNLATFGTADPHIASLALLDENGQVALSSDETEIGQSEADRDYFVRAFSAGLPFVSPVVLEGETDAYLYFSNPVRNPDGAVVGVLRVRYDAKVLQDMAVDHSRIVGGGSFAVLLDENRVFLADGRSSRPDTLFKTLLPLDEAHLAELQRARRVVPGSPEQATNHLDEVQAALTGLQTENFVGVESDFTGGQRDFLVTYDLQMQPWTVIFFQPESVFNQPVMDQSRTTFAIVMMNVVGLIGAAFVGAGWLAGPIARLTAAAEQVAAGDLTAQAPAETTDEIGALAATFNSMVTRLRETLAGLEARVAERTAELNYRATQLQTSAEVSRAIASTLDLEQLLTQVTQLISERFGFYHVGIFLIDGAGQYAVLQAANSEGGRRMLARQHKLRVGQTGIVGYATGTGQPRIALDVGQDAVYFDNPDLPATRSEMALPLKVRGRVIGALDAQSAKPSAFTEDDVSLLGMLADQVAIAIENARSFESQVTLAKENQRLLERSEQAREELDSLTRRLTREGWGSFLEERREARLAVDAAPEAPRTPAELPELDAASERLAPVVSADDSRSSVALPIVLRGESLGALALEDSTQRAWSEEDIALLENVAEHVALALDNARLLEEIAAAQRQAEARAEQLASVNRVAASVSTLLDLEEILRVAAREMGQTFRAYNTGIALLSADRETLTVVADYNAKPDEPSAVGVVIPVKGNPSSEYVLGTGNSLVIPDAQHHPLTAPIHDLMRARSTECLMILPLRALGDIIGTIGIEATERGRVFTDAEVSLAETIAGQIAGAVENARLFQDAQQRVAELAALGRVSNRLAATLDLDEILRLIVEEAMNLTGATHGSVALFHPDERELEVRVMRGFTPEQSRQMTGARFRPGQGLHGRLIETGQAVLVGDVTHDPSYPEVGSDSRSEFIVPIYKGEALLGALNVESPRPNAFTDAHVRLMTALASQIAIALENARLFEQTRAAAEDTLRLYTTSHAIVQAQTLDDALQAVLTFAAGLKPQRASIALADPQAEDWFETRAVWQPSGQPITGLGVRFRWSESAFASSVAGEGENTVIITDAPSDSRLPPRAREFMEGAGMRAATMLVMGTPPNLIGSFGLYWAQPHQLSARELNNLRTLTDLVATHIERLRLLDETERRALQLATAAEIARDTSSTLALDALLKRAVELVRERFGFYHVSIFLLDDTDTYAVVRESTGEAGEEMKRRGHKLAVGSQSIIGTVTASSQPLVVNDVSQNPTHRPNPLLPDTRAELGIPLKISERVVGALDVQSTQVNAFTPDDVAVLQTLADQIAVAADNAHLFDEINKRLTEQQWLHEVTTAAASAPTVESVLEGVVQAVRKAMHGALVSIILVEDDRQTMRIHAAAGYERDLSNLLLRVGQGVTGWVALTGEPARLGDVRTAPRYIESQAGVLSEMAVPLKLGKQVIGVINVESPEAEAFSEHDERLLETLSNTLAAIISNAQHFEAEQRQRRIALILANAAARMAQTLSEADLRRLLMSEIYEYLHPDRMSLYEWQGEAGQFVLSQRLGGLAEGDPRNPGDAISAQERPDLTQPFREQQAAWELRELANGTRRAFYVLPWAVGEAAAGVIEIVYPAAASHLLPEDQLLCEGLVDQAASALRLARLYAEQRETAERLAEVDKLKSQFLANMSHELRTPLNSIIGFSRVILKGIDGPITDLQQQDLNAIYHAGQHLLGLINDILDLSKIEAGKMELTFDEVDLSELVTSVMSTAVGLVKGKPIQLVRDIAPSLPPVRADAARIRQVMLNLLSNAAKFTDQGQVTVRAGLESGEMGAPPMVVVSVRDSGIGIAPDDQAKLFEPFSQVDASPTRKTGGSGLGLAISRHFVEAHGGRIWVESREGQGATFFFSLPLAQPPQPGELPLGADGKLVLAVDDNADLISLYRRYLEPGGYRVVGLTDSTLALETARRLRPFAILLDVFMKNKDGWQVIEELKADQDARQIPVIVCTISTERQRGLALGAADFLIKPILEEDLLEALERVGNGQALAALATVTQAAAPLPAHE